MVMLGLLHPERWTQCRRGHWVRVGGECQQCREDLVAKYASGPAHLWCPGAPGRPRHLVAVAEMAHISTPNGPRTTVDVPTGLCKECMPSQQPAVRWMMTESSRSPGHSAESAPGSSRTRPADEMSLLALRFATDAQEGGTARGVGGATRTPREIVLPSVAVASRPQVRRVREIDSWLLALLGEGKVPVAEIQRQAADRGWSWPQVKRAGQRVGVESEKPAWSGGWTWRRPT